MMLCFGCGGLDRHEVRGKYKVGAKEFWSKTTGCKVLMFYPIDKEEYDGKIKKSEW